MSTIKKIEVVLVGATVQGITDAVANSLGNIGRSSPEWGRSTIKVFLGEAFGMLLVEEADHAFLGDECRMIDFEIHGASLAFPKDGGNLLIGIVGRAKPCHVERYRSHYDCTMYIDPRTMGGMIFLGKPE